MSKKKLSKKKTANNQTFNKSKKAKKVPNSSRSFVLLSSFGLHLVEMVFDAIFEESIKDILLMVVNWIKSILYITHNII